MLRIIITPRVSAIFVDESNQDGIAFFNPLRCQYRAVTSHFSSYGYGILTLTSKKKKKLNGVVKTSWPVSRRMATNFYFSRSGVEMEAMREKRWKKRKEKKIATGAMPSTLRRHAPS
jgi:hypothetical protein